MTGRFWVLRKWSALLETERVAEALALETIALRNLTLAVCMVVTWAMAPMILAAGAPFSAAMVGLSGVAAMMGLVLSVGGYGRLGAILALCGLNVSLVLAVAENGGKGLEVGHIVAMTIPFNFFGAGERKFLVGALVMSMVGVVLAELPVWPFEVRHGLPSSTIRLIATLGCAAVVVGQLLLFSWIRRRTMAMLELALEACTVASQAKSAFVANMSQGSRASTQGMLDRLDELLRMPLPPEEREYAAIARISAQNLLDIVDDVLDLSRLEAGTLRVERHAVDLRATVDDVLARATSEAEPKGVELRTEYGPDVPEIVLADAARVRQVLINLVNNAVAFTYEGYVGVGVRQVEAKGERTVVEFSVEDTGIGIPKEAQAQVFETFEQVDASLTRTHEGVGLGLSICRGLVHAMGGQIGMSSEPGTGSRFWFTLPVRAVSAR
ncbi:MAG: ATP-binding protein [Myxococcota bacterium]